MEKAKCILTCPKCHQQWGEMKYSFDSYVQASDVKITAGKRKKFKNGEELSCPLCNYKYNNWDVILSISSGMNANGQA